VGGDKQKKGEYSDEANNVSGRSELAAESGRAGNFRSFAGLRSGGLGDIFLVQEGILVNRTRLNTGKEADNGTRAALFPRG